MDRTYVKPDAELLERVLCYLVCESLTGDSIDDFVDSSDYEW